MSVSLLQFFPPAFHTAVAFLSTLTHWVFKTLGSILPHNPCEFSLYFLPMSSKKCLYHLLQDSEVAFLWLELHAMLEKHFWDLLVHINLNFMWATKNHNIINSLFSLYYLLLCCFIVWDVIVKRSYKNFKRFGPESNLRFLLCFSLLLYIKSNNSALNNIQ